MTASPTQLRQYSTWILFTVMASSIAFALFLGKTPVMKLVLFLFGLMIWFGILSYVKETLNRGSKRG